MKKNRGRILTRGLSVLCVWVLSGIPAFAAEGESLMTVPKTINQALLHSSGSVERMTLTASVLTQTGGLNVLGYIAVGVAMAGFGFFVRKKI